MGVFARTERQCTEAEQEDEDEHDSQTSEFGLKSGMRREWLKASAQTVRATGWKPMLPWDTQARSLCHLQCQTTGKSLARAVSARAKITFYPAYLSLSYLLRRTGSLKGLRSCAKRSCAKPQA